MRSKRSTDRGSWREEPMRRVTRSGSPFGVGGNKRGGLDNFYKEFFEYMSNNGRVLMTYKFELCFPAWSYTNVLYTFLH